MKKEMVINVQMHSEKSRSKAMQLAASACGVDSVKVDGDKNELVVVGEVDPVILTRILRKKIGHSVIVKVAEVKKDDEESEEPKVEPNFAWYGCPPAPLVVAYEDPNIYSNPNVCSIM